jgi:hypothetical protein
VRATAAIVALTAAACAPRETPYVEVATLTISLHTPADVDPLLGADELVVRVYDPAGNELAVARGLADGELVIDELTTLGAVIIEVTAQTDGQILAAGRTPAVIVDRGAPGVDILFLPVNQAIELTHDLDSPRLDHVAFPTPSGRVALLGGRAPSTEDVYERGAWWDPVFGFSDDGPSLPRAGYDMTTTAYLDGTLLGSGGLDDAGQPLSEAWVLQADGARADVLPAMTWPRAGHCIARSQEFAALAIGGLIDPPNSVDSLRTGAWNQYLIDDLTAASVTGCWGNGDGLVVTIGEADAAWGVFDLRPSSANDIPDAFYRYPDTQPALDGALLVEDQGDLLIIGGVSTPTGEVTDTIRRLDPLSGEMTAELALPAPRAHAEALWFDDGVLAIAGGYADALGTELVHDLILFDVRSGALELSVDLPVRGGRLVPFPGGGLAVLGGIEADGRPAEAWVVLPWDTDGG